jgi:hypothetical protein
MRLYEGTAAYRFVATATPSPERVHRAPRLRGVPRRDGRRPGEDAVLQARLDQGRQADPPPAQGSASSGCGSRRWALFLQTAVGPRPLRRGLRPAGARRPLARAAVGLDRRLRPPRPRPDVRGRRARRVGGGHREARRAWPRGREGAPSSSTRPGRPLPALARPRGRAANAIDRGDPRRASSTCGARRTSTSASGGSSAFPTASSGSWPRSRHRRAGCNFQRHCHRAIFVGIGFKFADFIQAVHRIHRFLQTEPVRIDLIYTEAEREVRKTLERKWRQHNEQVERMGEIIREYGLASAAMAAGHAPLDRRRALRGRRRRLPARPQRRVVETRAMADASST